MSGETEPHRVSQALARPQADLQAAHAQVVELQGIAAEREAEITRLRPDLHSAGPVINMPAVLVDRAVRFSRRVLTRAVGAAQLAAGVRGRLPRLQARPKSPDATAAVDPNERYTFKPTELPPGAQHSGAQTFVSLDELYRLSRLL